MKNIYKKVLVSFLNAITTLPRGVPTKFAGVR